MNQDTGEKKIFWYSLAFMAFSAVWGFGNVINGFSEYGGLKAIVSWIIIFAVYFIPYALMVGELGTACRDAGGGGTRDDIIQGLNRLSSLLWILMCKCKGGHYAHA